MQNINLFRWFLLEYGWLKNPTIGLAENILTHISGTKFFPNMGFVQEYKK